MTLDQPTCPVRKLVPDDERSGPDLEWVSDPAGGRWIVRSFAAARQVLRDEEGFHQAGFGAERMRSSSGMRPPILYLEGAEHRAQRRAAARLFAPVKTETYRPMMVDLARSLVARLGARPVDLSRLSLRMAVGVAARVVGLTNSSQAGMSRRLNTFFAHDVLHRKLTPRTAWGFAMSSTATLRFYYLDVKPAIRARRRQRGDDVISQTLDAGFSDLDILTECVTYGAAGMVTTREFITVAAWHLLSHPPLLEHYRAASTQDRLALLGEALRLEPVVGHLYRRSVRAVQLTGRDGSIELPSGAMVDLDLRAVNADATAVGEDPLQLCPHRPVPRGVQPAVMSFGDGHHRCPGGPLALMESEIFLTELFADDVQAVGPPRVRWNSVTQGYDLDGFLISRRT